MSLSCLMTWAYFKLMPFSTLAGWGELVGDLSSFNETKGAREGNGERWCYLWRFLLYR